MFPTLYPTGEGDLHDNHFLGKPSPAEYAKHLVFFDKGQFIAHPLWRTIMVSLLHLTRNSATAGIFLQQNFDNQNITNAQLKEALEDNSRQLLDKLMVFAANERGSKSYWWQRLVDLER